MSQSPEASLTIRSLGGQLTARLRERAARNGRSMEAEALSILSHSLVPEADAPVNFVEAIRRHVDPLGGIELEEHPPMAIGGPPSLGR